VTCEQCFHVPIGMRVEREPESLRMVGATENALGVQT